MTVTSEVTVTCLFISLSFPNSPPEADKRFDTIRNFVALRENPGDLLGQDLLEKMKAQLKANKQDQTEEKPAV